MSWGEPGEPICVWPGMLELVELLLSESTQLSGEKLLVPVSMYDHKRTGEWMGVSQLAHIHVTLVWFSASYVSEFMPCSPCDTIHITKICLHNSCSPTS